MSQAMVSRVLMYHVSTKYKSTNATIFSIKKVLQIFVKRFRNYFRMSHPFNGEQRQQTQFDIFQNPPHFPCKSLFQKTLLADPCGHRLHPFPNDNGVCPLLRSATTRASMLLNTGDETRTF